MIPSFKFLNKNYTNSEIASWIWADEFPRPGEHRIVTYETHGIRELLSMFNPHDIIFIVSITGRGNRFTYENTGQGWPFDIVHDLLTIEVMEFDQPF